MSLRYTLTPSGATNSSSFVIFAIVVVVVVVCPFSANRSRNAHSSAKKVAISGSCRTSTTAWHQPSP